MIRTKLHVLAENVDVSTRRQGKDTDFVKAMMAAASFVIDDDVLDLLRRDDASKSIKALVQAGMVKLPYNPMVVEFEVLNTHHNFCLLREVDGSIYGRPVVMELKNCMAMCAMFEIMAEVRDGELRVHKGVYQFDNDESKVFLSTFATALNLALLMLNTKGVEKEVITVAAGLNKKRVKHGKPAIPTHSIVHIGTIYRSDGTAIKRDGHGGWHMPMHWRCGYTRVQHFGKGREGEKMVYIPPCIVNFKPDEAAPEAPHRKVKV